MASAPFPLSNTAQEVCTPRRASLCRNMPFLLRMLVQGISRILRYTVVRYSISRAKGSLSYISAVTATSQHSTAHSRYRISEGSQHDDWCGWKMCNVIRPDLWTQHIDASHVPSGLQGLQVCMLNHCWVFLVLLLV